MKLQKILILFTLLTSFGCTNTIFSDTDYKENISYEIYLLNKEDVVNALSSDPNKKIAQPFYSEIGDDPILFLRFKNNGNRRPIGGAVTCCIEEQHCFEINIYGLGFGNEYTTYFVQLTDIVLPQLIIKKNIQPTFGLTWNELHVK